MWMNSTKQNTKHQSINFWNSLLREQFFSASSRADVFPPLTPPPKWEDQRCPRIPSYKAGHSYLCPWFSTPTPLTACREQQPTGWKETSSWDFMEKENMNSLEWIVLSTHERLEGQRMRTAHQCVSIIKKGKGLTAAPALCITVQWSAILRETRIKGKKEMWNL